jgi:hypothetical protein
VSRHAILCSTLPTAGLSQHADEGVLSVLPVRWQACKPTSGWFALMFAYQACDEVSVYGFSAWRKQRDGLQQAPYHYFDQVHGVTNVHSFDLSKRCLQKLAETYKITLK